jgi:benzodiazapine receptor
VVKAAALRQRQVGWLLAFLAASFGAAGVGALFTARALKGGWYRRLRKPDWTPPDRVFGPVWTILYAQMAVSAWLVRDGAANQAHAARVALLAWCAQLGLNVAWSAAFFGGRSPARGVAVIVALWLAIVATAGLSARVRKSAGALLLPYLAWTSFAAALNVAIWRRNR